MPNRNLWKWLLCAWLALTPLARACPPEFETMVSPYERVRATTALVWAQAVSASKAAPGESELENVVHFEVREVLRGQLGVKRFRSTGQFVGAAEQDVPESGRYHQGASYLFFLTEPPEGGRVDLRHMMGEPVQVEAAGADSPLLAGARHYARIAALDNPAAERTALRALQAQAKAAPAGHSYPASLADDIAQHFQLPSRYKSYAELLALYRQPGATDDQKAYVLWAMASTPRPEARWMFEQLVRSGQWRDHATATAQFVSNTKDRALASRLLAELPTLHEADLHDRVLYAAIDVVDAREQPAMLRALREAEEDNVGALARWFVKYPSPAATALLKRSLKAPFEEQYELAFDLASLGDADVLAWGRRMAASKHEDAWMGYYAIARSPLPLADKLARQTIRQGDEESQMALIQGYEHATQPNALARLGDVVALSERRPKVAYWLERVLKSRAEAGEGRAGELLRVLSTRARAQAHA